MDEKKGFVLFDDQKEVVDKLTDEQAGKIFKAIYEYVETNEVPKLDTLLDLVFTPFKTSIDRNQKKWLETKRKRSEAGKKHIGNQYGTQDNKMEQNGTNGTNGTNVPNLEQMEQMSQNGTVSVSVSVSDSVSVSGSVSEEEKEEAVETATAFYLHNVNPVASEYELQQIQDYENALPSDLVIYALKIAVEQRKTSLSYIKAILRDWKTKGIVCLKQALGERLERQNKEPTTSNKLDNSNIAQFGDFNQYYANI